ncbi:hypothetical protein AURDEDRAFT_111379 [Auricularia subglabra TFB-10046 SS5]|nr:hypothetical protein AURDEDRAFT_111379 [Auricularia subglabra TFB-10046 SS5]
MPLFTLRAPALRSLFSISRRPLLPVARLVSNAASRPLSTRQAPTTLSRSLQTRLFSSSTRRQLAATPPPPPAGEGAGAGAAPKPFGARLKHLFKTYGLYAVGVYFFIGIFDFGLSFAAINLFGAEHVRALALRVRNVVAGAVGWRQSSESESQSQGGNEGLWAMLGLAYLLHKTVFLPFRVGLTAAATPPIVHWLRARGWAGGAGTRRAVQEMRDKVRDMRNKDRD